MKPRIGIITSGSSLSHMKQGIPPDLAQRCSLVYLPSMRISSVPDVYIKNAARLDGVLFNGRRGYTAALEKFGQIALPHQVLEVDQKSFYRLLLKIICTDGIDPRRISVDFLSEANQFLGLKAVLPPGRMPYLYEGPYQTSDGFYENIFRFHWDLFAAGKIDCALTNNSALAPDLQSRGLRCYCLRPSFESLAQRLETLVNEIYRHSIRENLLVVGLVQPDTPDPRVFGLISQFVQQQPGQVNLIPFEEGYQLTTTNSVLTAITANYTQCRLSSFLKREGVEAQVGWGVGRTMREALENAQNARRKSLIFGDHKSFIHTEENRIIGPLSDARRITYFNDTGETVERVSDQTGLSPLYVQKIISVMQKMGTNLLSCHDVAYYLGISIRSANRVLNRLEVSGLAQATARPSDSRGRPTKLYSIQFQ